MRQETVRNLRKWIKRSGIKITLKERIEWHLDEHIIDYAGVAMFCGTVLPIAIIMLLG